MSQGIQVWLGPVCTAGGCAGTGAPAKGLQREEQNFAQLWSTPAFSWAFDNKLFDEFKAVVSPEAKGTMSPVWLIHLAVGCGCAPTLPWGHRTLVTNCFGWWSRRGGTLQWNSCPSTVNKSRRWLWLLSRFTEQQVPLCWSFSTPLQCCSCSSQTWKAFTEAPSSCLTSEWIKDNEFMSTHAHSQEKGLVLVQLSY